MTELLEHRVRMVLDRIAPTHREAAARIGMEPTKLSKSLNGVRRLTATELAAMAEMAEVSVDWLVHGRGAAPGVGNGRRGTSQVPAADNEALDEDRRRHQYLEAAWRLIAEKGYHAVRVADIAQACGTSSGAVHYHFPGKQDVLEAAMRHCVEKAFARQSAALRLEENAHQRLLRLIDNQVPRGTQIDDEWSVWLQFWSESALRPELRPLHNEYYARWRETVVRIIERGIRQGVFQSVDAEEVALRFTCLTDGLGIQVMTGNQQVTPERMRAVLIDFVARELQAEDGPPRP